MTCKLFVLSPTKITEQRDGDMYGFKEIAVLTGIMFLTACDTSPLENGKDDIPADPFEQLLENGELTGSFRPFELIVNPAYTPVHELQYMKDDELVFMTKACGYTLVYPHRSMYVEVVNEEAHGVLMAISYCPITRSGMGWNRVIEKDTLLFTASGYLLKDNLMPLDVNSGSIWSQMLLRGMSGKHMQAEISTVPLIETSWLTVRDHFPGAGVYMNKSYQKSANGPYKQEFGILGREEVELFTQDMFDEEISLHSTTVRPGGRVVVAGSKRDHFMVAYLTGYTMEAVPGMFPVIMKDETGSYWNIFGEAVGGERGGETLQMPVSYSAADWAWASQFEKVKYFNPENP